MYAMPQLSDRLALDVQGVAALRAKARTGDPEALRTAAKQFEAMVVQTLLKNMRAARFAAPGDPLAESASGGLYRELLDQQWAQRMTAGRGFGFADAMFKAMQARQRTVSAEEMARLALPQPAGAVAGIPLAAGAVRLGGGGRGEGVPFPPRATGVLPQAGGTPAVPPPTEAAARPPGLGATSTAAPAKSGDHGSRFLDRLRPHAEKVAAETGLAADFILAHAALESGWGRHAIRTDAGGDSHNLFGIKAGRNWKGDTVERVTTEYRHGVALRTVQTFRAYDSYEAAFRDYAELLKARYPEAVKAGQAVDEFATALAAGGYATDPAYAEKLKRVVAGVARRSVQV